MPLITKGLSECFSGVQPLFLQARRVEGRDGPGGSCLQEVFFPAL